GYVWQFPSLVNGSPALNIGIYDSRVWPQPRADLLEILRNHLRRWGVDPDAVHIEGHPGRWYPANARSSRPRVLLVGDAAGAEPWLGEGISAALAYGPIAAATVCHALETGDFSFADYDRRIARSPLGWFLWRNRAVARLFYHRRSARFLSTLGTALRWYMNWRHYETSQAPLHQVTLDTKS
ncbi:MAG: hypothetical protein D6814_12110, partial [Calditrichaeota bacterium]